jgi:hypothetical protein
MYSFVLTTPGSTAISLASREAGGNAPQLILTAGGSVDPSPVSPPAADGSANILLLAGDICKHDPGATDYTPNCKKTGDLVRSVLAANPDAQVQTLGDNVNNDTGTYSYDSEYKDLYAPNWGSFLNVTQSLMGNHDTYAPSGTAPYFHNNSAATLEEVVDHYMAFFARLRAVTPPGGTPPPAATTDGVHFDRQPLPEEREALLAYLRRLLNVRQCGARCQVGMWSGYGLSRRARTLPSCSPGTR